MSRFVCELDVWRKNLLSQHRLNCVQFPLELHRYCISHFARVSFVPKWSYGQECKIVEQLCNVGIST